MSEQTLNLENPRPVSGDPIDWSAVLKHCELQSPKDLEETIRLIEKAKLVDFPLVIPAVSAEFLVSLVNLPEKASVLFPRNETGIVAQVIRDLRPDARFTFYSDSADIDALHRHLFPQAQIRGPAPLHELAIAETEHFDLILGSCDRGTAGFSRLAGEKEKTVGSKQFTYDDQSFIPALRKLLKSTGLLISEELIFSLREERKNENSLVVWQNHFGLNVVAAIENIPAGSSSYGRTFLVGTSDPQEKIFSAQYSDEEKIRQTIIKNFQQEVQGKWVHTGFWAKTEDYKSNRELRRLERIRRLATSAGLLPVSLDTLILNWKLGVSQDAQNVIYIEASFCQDHQYAPLLPSIASYPTDDNLNNWLEVSLDPDKVLAEYVIGFFNDSEIGKIIIRDLIAEHDEDVPCAQISADSVNNCVLYLPNREIQSEVVREKSRLSALQNEIAEISSHLWRYPLRVADVSKRIQRVNREDTFSSWLDQLPFPLASVLWSYHTQSRTEKEKYEKLLHFFEASAEFFSILHLSALASETKLWNEVKTRLKSQLSQHHQRISTPTFGTWLTLLEVMMKFVRTEKNNERKQEILHAYKLTRDINLERLCSKEIITILKETVAIRNKWQGHSGAINDQRAREIHDTLFSLLQKMRENITAIWECYDLVLPESMKFSDGEFIHNARNIKGNRTPFERIEIMTVEPMEDKTLHLVSCETNRVIKLLPFMQIVPGPITEIDACYFYNRIEDKTGEARFVSYHFDRDSELETKIDDKIAAAFRLFNE